jgi:hypothetical protein
MNEDARITRLLVDTVAVSALEQVLDVAGRAGVVAVPVKGVVLSRWIYAAVVDRPFRDLDLLVRRDGLVRLTAAVRERAWPIRQLSFEMGELELEVDGFVVEVHAEFGRRDLTRLSTAEVIARAVPERETFPFEILRVDDIDHFLLLVANVTKKAYTYANRHTPEDLERLLARLEPRWAELAARAWDARFTTALRSVGAWMVEDHDSLTFARFLRMLPPRPRPGCVEHRLARAGAARIGPDVALGHVALSQPRAHRADLRRGRGLVAGDQDRPHAMPSVEVERHLEPLGQAAGGPPVAHDGSRDDGDRARGDL